MASPGDQQAARGMMAERCGRGTPAKAHLSLTLKWSDGHPNRTREALRSLKGALARSRGPFAKPAIDLILSPQVGLIVKEASTGRRLCEPWPPEKFDVVLLDMQLPERNASTGGAIRISPGCKSFTGASFSTRLRSGRRTACGLGFSVTLHKPSDHAVVDTLTRAIAGLTQNARTPASPKWRSTLLFSCFAHSLQMTIP